MTARPELPEATRLIEEVSLFLAEQATSRSDDGSSSSSRHRILLPYTDTAPAQTALEAAIGLSSAMFAEVWVLHIREWELGMGHRWFRRSREEAVAVTRQALDRLQRHGVDARGIVRQAVCSRVAEEITDKADELRVSAIVLGARPRRLISSILLPSVSRRVSRIANCPVILARCDRTRRPERNGDVAGNKRYDDEQARRSAA